MTNKCSIKSLESVGHSVTYLLVNIPIVKKAFMPVLHE